MDDLSAMLERRRQEPPSPLLSCLRYSREVNVYCPECGVEYRAGFTECVDCRVPLVAAKPPDATGPGDPNLQLVIVLEGNDPLLIGSAKGVLEEAGIPFHVLGDELGVRLGPVGALIHPWCRVQVAADREHEARTLLQELEDAQNPEASLQSE